MEIYEYLEVFEQKQIHTISLI